MKKIKIILLALVVGVSFSACTKLVDTTPESSIPIEDLITNDASAENAVNGMYSALQLSYNTVDYTIMALGVYSDNLSHTGTYPDLAQLSGNQPQASNFYVDRIWRDHYDAIYRANVIISQLESGIDGVTEEGKSLFIAHGKFVRALMYFKLVNLYGGIPLILEPVNASLDDINKERANTSEVYTQIKSDLSDAIIDLPEDGSVYKGTKGAARGVLAKVHLYLGEYNDVVDQADQVFESGIYALEANFEDLWTPNESAEALFRIDFTTTDNNALAFFFFPSNLGGRYEVGPSGDLRASIEDDDTRNMIQDWESGAFINKYNDVATGIDKIYVLRFADLILMYAEAKANLGDYSLASEAVNMIRSRAGLGDVTVDSGNWKDIIMQERRVELFAEGDRWMDIKRSGLAEEVLTAKNGSYNADKDLWPIPQTEIDRNSLINSEDQNPSY
ncbi:MAG: RagB/SusD family nutrient uptake outer membrane protein [Bacteroidota bacterium]